jgi:hypothetical protein
MSESSKRLRTIDIEPDEHMLIKPGELIDIVELSPLTLQDRRIYNLLILNAWDSITEPKEHRIHKRDLRGSHHTNERVGESLLRLMGAVAQLRIERDAGEGMETFTRRVQLLAGTEEAIRGDGLVFCFGKVRGIIRESSQYARLQKQVLPQQQYALALQICKRGNLTQDQRSSVDAPRCLGSRRASSAFKSFKQRAIDPAARGQRPGEFGCKVAPIYAGCR